MGKLLFLKAGQGVTASGKKSRRSPSPAATVTAIILRLLTVEPTPA